MNRPDTVHGYAQGLHQLDDLVSYAERLQDIIERKNAANSTQKTIYYFLLALLLGLTLSGVAYIISADLSLDSPAFLFTLVTSITSITIALTLIRFGNSRSQVDVERRILSEVVEMSSSLFQRLEGEQISPVDHKLLALRLRRLSLSGTEFL
jgi:hypothetical protein